MEKERAEGMGRCPHSYINLTLGFKSNMSINLQPDWQMYDYLKMCKNNIPEVH